MRMDGVFGLIAEKLRDTLCSSLCLRRILPHDS